MMLMRKGDSMEVKMQFQKETSFDEPLGDSVAVELRGAPVLVESLKTLIVDFMKKQEGFDQHY